MYGTIIHDERRARHHFSELTHAEQVEAIRGLADDGLGDYSIAAATKLSVEQVRRIVGERRESAT